MKSAFLIVRLTTFLILGALPAATAVQAQTSQKVIKDPNEYNAYITALDATDPAAKAAAMEAFIARYPGSILKTDALEQAMAAYQQVGNVPKLEAATEQLVTIDPDNARALAILTALERAAATSGDAKALVAMRTHAEQGLRTLAGWQKPEGMSDADFEALRSEMSVIFGGATGFGLLKAKDYAGAREAYLRIVGIGDPDMQSIYQLGMADAEMTPLDVRGFWYLAKAMALATAQNNAVAAQAIEKYAKAKYHRYHGSDDGWDEIVVAAARQTSPPDGFAASIKGLR